MDNDLLEADAMLADVEAKLASALKKHEVNATLATYTVFMYMHMHMALALARKCTGTGTGT